MATFDRPLKPAASQERIARFFGVGFRFSHSPSRSVQQDERCLAFRPYQFQQSRPSRVESANSRDFDLGEQALEKCQVQICGI
ncbi:MAG: hypothetical protein C4334_04310 [Pyrinomonas sp.]